ncbi:MAG TPA: hypothetical protein VFE16_06440 [Candidatus Cybelea sp.]|jgi:hypothetical protein|nr:hypothetical protein [Candidatus Cybelea sp.]
MTSSTALLPSVRAAFGSLIDYAGLFPPAALSLAEAETEYAEARRGSHAWMLGRFIIPASTLAALPEIFDAPFSAIVEADLASLEQVIELRERGVRIEALEIPLRESFASLQEYSLALPAFVEISRTHGWGRRLPQALEELARLGLAAKLRCGGVTADAFPSVDEVGEFIAAAATARIPFKATAGLHHPVRRLDETSGFTMHGFLNILAAAALAPRLPRKTLLSVIAEEDPQAFVFDEDSFAWRSERVVTAELEGTRRNAFVSYGSCSFAEPVDDLTALGLLPLV